jgi:hypothetical protein
MSTHEKLWRVVLGLGALEFALQIASVVLQ